MFAFENRRNSPPRGDWTSPTFEPLTGEERAIQEGLDEGLRIERRVDFVLHGDGVRREDVDDLDRGEARAAHAASPVLAKVLSSDGSGASRSGEGGEMEMSERPTRNWA